jgi:hypothetical protein
MFTAKDYDQALLTPQKIFDLPMEVVETESLTAKQKLEVLKRWEADAHDLEVATDESMSGGERSRLGEVRRAIDELSKRENVDEKSLDLFLTPARKMKLGRIFVIRPFLMAFEPASGLRSCELRLRP